MQLLEFNGLTTQLFYFFEIETTVICAARNACVAPAIQAMGGEKAVIFATAMRLLAEKNVEPGDMIAVSQSNNEDHMIWAVVEAACVGKKNFSVGLYGFPLGRIKHLTNTGQEHLVSGWLQKNRKSGGIKLVSALGKIWTSKQDPENELAIGACAVVDQLSQGRSLMVSFEGLRDDEILIEYWVASSKDMEEMQSQNGSLAA